MELGEKRLGSSLKEEELGEEVIVKTYDRVLSALKERRKRILSGKINCIPWGMPRFEMDIPGIEQGKFVGITANQKVGKTQLCDYMFLYQPISYMLNNPGKVKMKIFYITLEMSVEQKYQQYMCHLLYILTNGKIRIAPKDLRSTSKDKPLDQSIIDLLSSDEYKRYLDLLENTVTFTDSVRNPFGIYSLMREYAQANGVQHKKTIKIKDSKIGKIVETEIDDYYEPNDPEEYVLLIVDHVSLITPESTEGNDLRRSIVKFTSDYCVKLRNKYKYTVVVVQQQAQDQEGLENFKASKLRPTASGLGDAKTTSRDFDYLLGLFSPARHDLETYKGYDIRRFKDHIRFLEIIAGREGGGGSLYPLYFDGAVNIFRELPLPGNQAEIAEVYDFIKELNQ